MSLKRKTRTLCARLSHGMGPIVSAAALAAILASSTQAQNEDTLGRWEQPLGGYDWPLIAMHAVHLSTGKILVWKNPDNPDPQLWDPATGDFTAVPPVPPDDLDINCSGHVALANGSILLAGGAGSNNEAWIFSLDDLWQPAASMQYGRFYPTCTTVPSGDVLVISGRTAGGQPVLVPEIYDPGQNAWEALPQQVIEFKTYPFMFVLPDAGTGSGTVFYAGGGMAGGNPGLNTYTLDVATGTWSAPIPSHFLGRQGSAVMFEPGKVLKSGGFDGSDIINYTDVIDFTDPSPQWELDLFGMFHPRRWHTLVVVADGKILAVGGEKGDPADPTTVLAAEWIDPNDPFPLWKRLDEMSFKRANHSTAMLLANATVLVAGGDDGDPNPATAEIFKPPYLFWGPRPVIGYAPKVITYGVPFKVILSSGSPVEAAEIDKVSLVRLAAVTHSFDQDQRYVPLTFTVIDDHSIQPDAPADGNEAPPGYYMLFLVSNAGVPSVAPYVRLE